MEELGHTRFRALGTDAVILTTDPSRLGIAVDAAQHQIDAIDRACSRFREDSELSRLSASAGRPVRVGPLLFEALGVALRAAQLTGGAVDPTVGRALVLAGYDRDFAAGLREPARVPGMTSVPGWRTIELEPDGMRVTIPEGVLVDLGATAKALAADRAAVAASRAASGGGVLVDLGGDIAVAGPSPAGGWTVRVADDHRAGPEAAGQSLTIESGGLATSSCTVRRWGRASHHIVDPRTGLPAVSPWRTVSVAAGTCVDANIASTAAIVLGDRAVGWLQASGLPARLVQRDGRVIALTGWPAERLAA